MLNVFIVFSQMHRPCDNRDADGAIVVMKILARCTDTAFLQPVHPNGGDDRNRAAEAVEQSCCSGVNLLN